MSRLLKILTGLFLFLSWLEGEEPPNKQLIDRLILQFMEKQQIPGLAAAIDEEGQDYLLSYGFADLHQQIPITPNTIFEIGSVTKLFTATELALQVLEGRVKLNHSISLYIPSLQKEPLPIQKVTLFELATHTSGLPRIPPRPFQTSHEKIIQYLRRWKPQSRIGTTFLYSNLGFGLLGTALVHSKGSSYEEVIRKDLLIPLKMKTTMISVPRILDEYEAQGYRKNGRKAPKWKLNRWPGGGALRSTLRDMLLFLQANLGVRGPPQILKAMQLAQKAYFKVNDRLSLGLAWHRILLNGQLIIDKNGGTTGFSCYMGMLPEKKIGIVLLANKTKTKINRFGRHLLLALNRQSNKLKNNN